MHIFIDESGLFIPSGNTMQWSTVGAFVIPDTSIDDVNYELIKLKKENGFSHDQEFKRNRPDSENQSFLRFVNKLIEYKCTLYVSSQTGFANEKEGTLKHKEKTIEGVKNYLRETNKSSAEYDNIIDMLTKLSPQQYSQCIFQAYLIASMLGKVITLYSKLSPYSLGKFIWIIDRKDTKEISYDKVFESLYTGLIMLSLIDMPLHIVYGEQNDFSYFLKNYLIEDKSLINQYHEDTKNIYKRNFGDNQKHINPFHLDKLLSENFFLEDSKNSFGLQVADLLISSVNRCLKGNFTDNKKMASLLGTLMVNSHKKDEAAILLNTLSNQRHIEDDTGELINLMDRNSCQLYKFKKEK